jgi:hypothetical protein
MSLAMAQVEPGQSNSQKDGDQKTYDKQRSHAGNLAQLLSRS